MVVKAARMVIALAALLAAAGCAGGDGLMNVRSESRSPDEFKILPTKSIEIPAGGYSVAALPVPTPGGANRTDPHPKGDAIAALGGNPAVVARGTADGGIVNAAARHGIDPSIRESLASEDLAFRQGSKPLFFERLLGVTTYYSAYEDSSLDQNAELARWRASGVRTVGAPPAVAQ